MARRGRRSFAHEWIDTVAQAPWWVGVGLAIAAYVLLGRWAAPGEPLPPTRPALAAVVRGLASAGQLALPLLCLAGAGLSVWRRRQRAKLLDDTASRAGARSIDGLDWRAFEQLVGEAFRRQGYQVQETGGGGADGGVDLVLSRPARDGRELTLVQCKHWRAQRVGVEVLRQLYGVMAARGAAAGIVITSGRFTDEAQNFAQGGRLRLIDGPALQALIVAAQRAAPAAQPVRPAPATPAAPAAAVPACPRCGKPMVLRAAQRGAQAGQRFWGCSAYPGCRGTRPLEPG